MEDELQKEQVYRDVVISWEEPQATSAGWVMNIVDSDEVPMQRLQEAQGGKQGSKIISARTLDDGITEAKAFINRILA